MRHVLGALGLVVVVGCGGAGATILGNGDGGGGDSGSASDASGDAAPSPDAADDATDGSTCTSPPVCAANQQCTTFDDANPFPPFSSSAKGSGTVQVTSTTSVSCPSSLLATLPAVAAASGARATISSGAQISTAPPHVSLELDVLLPAQTSAASFFTVFPDSGGSVGLFVDGAGTWSLVVRGGTSTPLAPQPKVGVWTHMKLDVTFGGDSVGKATLAYGGDTTTFSGNTNPTNGNVGAVGVEVGIDPGDGATTTAMSAYYDNVVYSPF